MPTHHKRRRNDASELCKLAREVAFSPALAASATLDDARRHRQRAAS